MQFEVPEEALQRGRSSSRTRQSSLGSKRDSSPAWAKSKSRTKEEPQEELGQHFMEWNKKSASRSSEREPSVPITKEDMMKMTLDEVAEKTKGQRDSKSKGEQSDSKMHGDMDEGITTVCITGIQTMHEEDFWRKLPFEDDQGNSGCVFDHGKFGEIVHSVNFAREPSNCRSIGVAFVKFFRKEDMKKAMRNWNRLEIKGRDQRVNVLQVDISKKDLTVPKRVHACTPRRAVEVFEISEEAITADRRDRWARDDAERKARADRVHVQRTLAAQEVGRRKKYGDDCEEGFQSNF